MHKLLGFILTIVVIVGAINWLTEGLTPGKNLVHRLVGNEDGTQSKIEKGVYVLVGLSGLVLLGMKLKWAYEGGLSH